MKTTLIIEDSVMIRLKEEAARTGSTISELVESALRLFFSRAKKAEDLPPLPTFDSGGSYIDVSSREALDELRRKG